MLTVAEQNRVAGFVPAIGVPPAPLEQVDAFQFSEAVYKFVDYYDVEESVAEAMFFECKRWLWLCATSMHERDCGQDPPDLMITGSLFWLDEMWHIFLQFTEPYQEFCERYLGRFVHHRPTTRAEKLDRRAEIEQESAEFLKEREATLRRQCNYICDKLGADTMVRWYREYPRQYSAEELYKRTKMRQPPF